MAARHIVVVGGGITGLTVAERLAVLGGDSVTVEVRETGDRLGGKLRTSPFAGRPAVDEGADAFLARVPHGTALAARVGLADELTSPATASAAVWHDGLHPIPDGLLLGVPGDVLALARSRLLSTRGKLRAAVEPLLPRGRGRDDSVGRLVRARLGDEVHERLVDALVGSIYAADTDRFSLAMVPQLASLAERGRSLLLTARRGRAAAPPVDRPLFHAPLAGMESLATATAAAAETAGAAIKLSHPVASVSRDGDGWRVDDDRADAVVLATPAAPTAPLLDQSAPELAALLSTMDHASVAIVTLAVSNWPARLHGRSGYLVPKPDQKLVTAASFGSQKWAHWRGDDELVRVSLGRDGLRIDDLDDEVLTRTAVAELGHHTDLDVRPTAVRISRWSAAFPQYRPGHRRWLNAVAGATPSGLFLTGASYRGIGVPACIADAEQTATAVLASLGAERSAG